MPPRRPVFANPLPVHPAFQHIIVVIGKGQEALARNALTGLPDVILVEGGKDRIDSVRNAIHYLDNIGFSGNTFIHDAARPFLSAQVIDRLLGALASSEGAVPALPVVDSL